MNYPANHDELRGNKAYNRKGLFNNYGCPAVLVFNFAILDAAKGIVKLL
jgi:hypothetical protein